MNEIYVLILKPSKITGHCQLENYKGESTLTNWLKSACLFYCYGKYRKKVVLEPIQDKFINGLPDRFQLERDSINIDTSNINEDDIENIIQTMSNRRYQEIIRLKYLRHYSNEEVATLLGMTIDNFYNKHRLAKIQFENMLKKEVRDEL